MTAGADTSAIIWSSVSGEKLQTLKGHAFTIQEVSWSPDGNKIATASWDKSCIIWQASNGEKLFTLSHGWIVWNVTWSSDNSKLLTSSEDAPVIWSLNGGEKLQTLKGHTASTIPSWSQMAPK
ncbi:MAG: hypothetical protein IPL27_24120 [Lewinellaceae bacterium]|nr:hypothetical protein [Lewinellaceae bacterium]